MSIVNAKPKYTLLMYYSRQPGGASNLRSRRVRIRVVCVSRGTFTRETLRNEELKQSRR